MISSVGEMLLEERCLRKMAILLTARNDIVTHIVTLYNHGELKSISAQNTMYDKADESEAIMCSL